MNIFYLEKINEKTYKIILPDIYGNFETIPTQGLKVDWPTCPNFSGLYGIEQILKNTTEFKNCNFIA